MSEKEKLPIVVLDVLAHLDTIIRSQEQLLNDTLDTNQREELKSNIQVNKQLYRSLFDLRNRPPKSESDVGALKRLKAAKRKLDGYDPMKDPVKVIPALDILTDIVDRGTEGGGAGFSDDDMDSDGPDAGFKGQK